MAKFISAGTKSKKGNGCHPPKNKSAVNVDISIMCEYSANMNSAKVIPEYSTLYPDTNSDSPSVKSNGARFVSAKAETKNIIAAGKSGTMNQMFCWASTISVRLMLLAHIITVIRIKPIDTS
jgi:hypothetical protein